jgi:quercetin dioxygenase-like cupin family protein
MHAPTPTDLAPQAVPVDDLVPVEVGPGCLRRDLPSTPDVRVWMIDIAAHHRWPHVDHHPTGEEFYVVSGELIDGERRFHQGSYVFFPPGTSHQPRTETGARLFGFNLVPRDADVGCE